MKQFTHHKVDLGYEELFCETLESGRTYITPGNKKYPSITTVLGILSKAGIDEWKERVGFAEANAVSKRGQLRGTAVHDVVERYLKNQSITTSKLMPHIAYSFKNLKPILDESIDNIFLQEFPLYSDHLAVAGRVDLIAHFEGTLSIIDFKTSASRKSAEDITSYFMQEAAYAIMYEERTGVPINQLITLIAVDNDPKIMLFKEKRNTWSDKLIETIQQYKNNKRISNE